MFSVFLRSDVISIFMTLGSANLMSASDSMSIVDRVIRIIRNIRVLTIRSAYELSHRWMVVHHGLEVCPRRDHHRGLEHGIHRNGHGICLGAGTRPSVATRQILSIYTGRSSKTFLHRWSCIGSRISPENRQHIIQIKSISGR